jgi:hypothetical protein
MKINKQWICMLTAAMFLAGAAPAMSAEDESPDLGPRPGLTPQQQEQEARFKEGMEALEDDRLKTAIRAFSTILDIEPELNRAKLELALAYYRSMRYEEAEKLAQKVLDDPKTPPEVRVTILAFLAQVKRDSEAFGQKHSVKPFVAAGIMHDSNVNVGPTSICCWRRVRWDRATMPTWAMPASIISTSPDGVSNSASAPACWYGRAVPAFTGADTTNRMISICWWPV